MPTYANNDLSNLIAVNNVTLSLESSFPPVGNETPSTYGVMNFRADD